MPIPRRADLDKIAYDLHTHGHSLASIGKQLGVTSEMIRRRVHRYKRMLAKSEADESHPALQEKPQVGPARG